MNRAEGAGGGGGKGSTEKEGIRHAHLVEEFGDELLHVPEVVEREVPRARHAKR